MESFFNDAEKRFILAEMIKLSQLDVEVLVDFVKSHGIQPNWMHMHLPGGRNMSQCVHAAEIMFNTPMPPPVISPPKRKSLGDLPEYASKRQAVGSPGELSPRGIPLGPNIQPTSGGQPVNIQPRPNGYNLPPLGPTPSVSSTPYNPAPTGRRRGRPPKSVQSTWQVSTYPAITPAPIAPLPGPKSASQPHSPGPQTHPTHQPSLQTPSDAKSRKKALPEIAPRPTQMTPSIEPAVKSPAVPGPEYPSWREEAGRRECWERPASTYPPILPRPPSPHAHAPHRELVRPASTEPTAFRETSPPTAPGSTKNERQTSTAEPIKT